MDGIGRNAVIVGGFGIQDRIAAIRAFQSKSAIGYGQDSAQGEGQPVGGGGGRVHREIVVDRDRSSGGVGDRPCNRGIQGQVVITRAGGDRRRAGTLVVECRGIGG